MQLVIKTPFCWHACILLYYSLFSLLILLFYSELCCWDILSLIFFMIRNIATVICPSERRKTINIISVQIPLELGDMYYTFGNRVETDAISKVLNLKFWNLCLSKIIKHLICQCSFMQRFFFSRFFKQ